MVRRWCPTLLNLPFTGGRQFSAVILRSCLSPPRSKHHRTIPGTFRDPNGSPGIATWRRTAHQWGTTTVQHQPSGSLSSEHRLLLYSTVHQSSRRPLLTYQIHTQYDLRQPLTSKTSSGPNKFTKKKWTTKMETLLCLTLFWESVKTPKQVDGTPR